MKLHQVTALVAALVFAGLLGGLGMRQRQLHDLRDEFAARDAEPRVVEPAVAAQPSAAPVEAPLSDAELRELLTLRRDVARLRQENPRLTALRAENARLKSALTNTLTGGNSVAVPEGYLLGRQARFVGFATPEQTLQSFLWSLHNRDTNVLFQVQALAPDVAESLARQLEHLGVDKFFENMGVVPGFLIRGIEHVGDGSAVAELQFDPSGSDPGVKLPLERDANGAWRLRMQ